LALELAEKYNGEIIGADSWTVYRGLTIGTAKPTAEEMARVPHHLFDVVDATEGFSAVIFKRLAISVIEEIQARGKLPILVGGTGLYIDSVLYDYEFMPSGEPGERERLSAMSLDDLLAEATRLELDLSHIDTRNKRRVIRAIETKGMIPARKHLRENTLVLGLATDRDKLRSRVSARVDAMLAAGLEKEVRHLAEQYGWDVEPMKGIGYREWRDYFLGTQSIDQTRERIISSTINLAKRQRTWFKRNSSIQWIQNSGEGVDLLTTYLNKNA
jgi:tRNA dimethylallyltransferase